MGMFDSLFDTKGNEWQTKAFGCILDRFEIGDRIVSVGDFQVEVCGGEDPPFEDSFATIRAGVLAAVPVDRDPQLPLMDYHGYILWPDGTERREPSA